MCGETELPRIKFHAMRSPGQCAGSVILCFFIVLAGLTFNGKTFGQDINSWLDAYNVSWNIPGPTSSQSMPLGNGDIGLNVWVETNGDLVFYISKTDDWNGYYLGDSALMKLGGVRISLNPRPALTPFLQMLKLRTGEIQIQEDTATLRVWVDANNPAIRIEVTNAQPVSLNMALNNWRTPSVNDVTVSGQINRLVWYHRNSSIEDSHYGVWLIALGISGFWQVVDEHPGRLYAGDQKTLKVR